MATSQRTDGTAVATIDRKGITALLQTDDAKARITPMLRGLDYDRVIGETYLAASENPEILKCTPASIVRAVARAVGWGLEIGQTVHLVPFNVNVAPKGQDAQWEKRLTAIRDYKGDIELVLATGAARSIRAQVVYAGEQFEYIEGTTPTVRHVPAHTQKERGTIIGAYAIADHGYSRPPHVVYLTLEDVDAIRQKHSKQWKTGPMQPWYMRKTAVKQLTKMLPKNTALAKVLAMFEQEDVVEDEEDPAALSGEPVTTIEPPRNDATAATDNEAYAGEFQDDRDIA